MPRHQLDPRYHRAATDTYRVVGALYGFFLAVGVLGVHPADAACGSLAVLFACFAMSKPD